MAKSRLKFLCSAYVLDVEIDLLNVTNYLQDSLYFLILTLKT